MNIKGIFGWLVPGIAVSLGALAQTTEPGLDQVKIIAVSAPTQTAVRDTCLYSLNSELRRAGRKIQEATDGADAELVAAFDFKPGDHWLGGADDMLDYSIVVKSIPGGRLLYADHGFLEGSKLDKSCAKIAKKTVKALLHGK